MPLYVQMQLYAYILDDLQYHMFHPPLFQWTTSLVTISMKPFICGVDNSNIFKHILTYSTSVRRSKEMIGHSPGSWLLVCDKHNAPKQG